MIVQHEFLYYGPIVPPLLVIDGGGVVREVLKHDMVGEVISMRSISFLSPISHADPPIA
jgi:hypothetical protein